MTKINPQHGISTLATHALEDDHPLHANASPIFQNSTFRLPDVATGAAIFSGEQEGYVYTRWDNPNQLQTARKIAVLEGLDLLKAEPERDYLDIVDGRVFSSGMAAVTSAVLALVKAGDTIITQDALYSATYNFFANTLPNYGVKIVWLHDTSPAAWEEAFERNPGAKLAYAETPVNPTLSIVDLPALAEIAHRRGAQVIVDNTFATPYCQRPLTMGVDVVLHSTTKYLHGHGQVIGGVVVSRHVDYIKGPLTTALRTYGGTASPFDCWLVNSGLKTFELRMQRQCENARQAAAFLERHPAVERVYYPGLESSPDYALARRMMHDFGGMVSFELKGGFKAGEQMMNRVRLCRLAVSLGHIDSLIQHPASMTHSYMSPEARSKMGVSEGLVRFSLGIENSEDILADLEQALA